MLTIRYYRALRWIGLRLARLPFEDRWGFNLGHDLDDWATLRMFAYLLRLQKASGFSPVQVTGPPKPMFHLPTVVTTTVPNATATWTGHAVVPWTAYPPNTWQGG